MSVPEQPTTKKIRLNDDNAAEDGVAPPAFVGGGTSSQSPAAQPSPFHGLLDVSLQKHILSFIVHPFDYTRLSWLDEKRKANATTIQHCTRVSHAWRDLTNQLVQEHNLPVITTSADGEKITLITVQELMDIKHKIAHMDFMTVRNTYVEQLQTLWGEDTLYWEYGDEAIQSLSYLMEEEWGSIEHFSKIAEREYRMFWTVKAVETLVATKYATPGTTEQDSKVLQEWLQPCRPSKLVNVFWNAHAILHPTQYQTDCQTLLGATIDYVEPTYSSENVDAGPTYKDRNYYDKQHHLFAFELQSIGQYHGGWFDIFQCYHDSPIEHAVREILSDFEEPVSDDSGYGDY